MTRRIPIERFAAGLSNLAFDELSVEEPLQVLINGKPFATLMRTPGDDIALVEGFLFSEGIVASIADIVAMETTQHPTSQEVHVRLAGHCQLTQASARSLYLSSSCGVCGRASVDQLLDRIDTIPPLAVSPGFLISLLPAFGAAQKEFPRTGGVHAAALFSSDGTLLLIHEDVGRHNALDKLIGESFRAGTLPLHQSILMMSSRASFDIVQKAATAGIPVVAAMGAASSLAASLAQAAGIHLHCFVREKSLVSFPLLRRTVPDPDHA